MPEFDKEPNKIQSRQDLLSFYRWHSGKKSISKNRQLWSLCSDQSRRPLSEINQFTSEGLITKEQYWGVDKSENKIKRNQKKHPEANWLFGDWETTVLAHSKEFNPEIVFLDFTSMANTNLILSATNQTMRLCSAGTYLFVNVMLNNPRDPSVFLTEETFPIALAETLDDNTFRGWKVFYGRDIDEKLIPYRSLPKNGVLCYPYNCTSYTMMTMYPFYKEA